MSEWDPLEIWDDPADDYDEDAELDIDDLDEWVFDCGDPDCCMPGPHFRYECHTPEMIEAQMREAESASEPQEQSHGPNG